MVTPEFHNRKRPQRGPIPHWVSPIVLTLGFLLVHVAAPWGLSLLSNRYGWVNGRPGLWNLLALVPVGAGIACTIWTMSLHYRASPTTFLEFRPSQKLLTPGPYAFSRNPMYLFELAFWLGWTLFYGSIAVLIGCLLFFAVLNFAIVPYEERDLAARFGESYREYKKRVPCWLGQVQH